MNIKNDFLAFKIPAIKIKQKEEEGIAIYFAKIKAKDLSTRTIERFAIDYFIREHGEDRGYQRGLSESSVDKIKDFILRETMHPILPTALLASSREELEFKEINKLGLGELEITDKLYIIDGQHRFEAWKSLLKDPILYEEWQDFEIPVVIISGLKLTGIIPKPIKEMEQFYIINSRQKKIKTDLAQRLLLNFAKQEETKGLIAPKDFWVSYAVVITDALNEQRDNIWKGKIVIEGDSQDLKKTKIINQNSFVSSLKPFFTGVELVFNIPKIKPDECIDFLVEFWNIVAAVYPLIIDNPHDYSLMKTVGVFALHIFLNNVTKRNGGLQNKNKILREVRTALLSASDDIKGNYKTDFWRSKVPTSIKERGRYAGGYSSGAGHNRLALGIENNILI